MVVPVASVGSMPVPVVHVVGVPLVRYGYVAAFRSVLVRMALMLRVLGLSALVDVVAVDAVHVPVVHVVGVIPVRDRDVAAALAVDVRMIGVRVVASNTCRSPILSTDSAESRPLEEQS